MTENGEQARIVHPSTADDLPIIYMFDVDETLWVSHGPIQLIDLIDLKRRGFVLGLCGNYAAVTLRITDWHKLFSLVGPMYMTKAQFLSQIKSYIAAKEVVMVGNIKGVTGESDDEGAAKEVGVRFIQEAKFALGER